MAATEDAAVKVSGQQARQLATNLYRILLGRDPDPSGLDHFSGELGRRGVSAVVEDFVASAEYSGRRSVSPHFALNTQPSDRVDTRVSREELAQLWAHTAAVWAQLGDDDPYWSVLTDERFRIGNMEQADRVDEFYRHGGGDLHFLNAFLTRSNLALRSDAVVTEYGCGVGRFTHWLAPHVGHVHAFDISLPHLRSAEIALRRASVDNVTLHHIKDVHDLENLPACDLFYSLIVLQHNPPPVIVDILTRAFASLQPDGIAFFQVPTYARGYTFSLQEYWDGAAKERALEMHFVPQSEIFDLARKAGLKTLEVRQDHCIGNADSWISNTFLFQKA